MNAEVLNEVIKYPSHLRKKLIRPLRGASLCCILDKNKVNGSVQDKEGAPTYTKILSTDSVVQRYEQSNALAAFWATLQMA